MKKYYIFLVVFAGLAFFGCEDYLDKSPDLGLDENKVYSDYYSYKKIVDNAHYYVWNQLLFREQGTNHMIGIISDEAQTNGGSQATNFNSGNWLNMTSNDECGFIFNKEANNFRGSVMGGAFTGIRVANLAIENIN